MRTGVCVIVLLCCVNFEDELISNQQKQKSFPEVGAKDMGTKVWWCNGNVETRDEAAEPSCEDGVWSGGRRESTLATLTTASRLGRGRGSRVVPAHTFQYTHSAHTCRKLGSGCGFLQLSTNYYKL